MFFQKKHKTAVWAVSITLFIVFTTLLIIQGIYIPIPPYFIPISQRVNNSIALNLFVALLIPAILENNNIGWLRKVEENTPRALLDITEGVRSGIPLLDAMEDATHRNYGPVSKELKRSMIKFRMTSDLKRSLDSLGVNLIRPIVKRMNTILLVANEMGGQIIDVLDASVLLFTDIAEYQDQRRTQLKPYILIVYFGLFIFLAIGYVILVTFLGPLSNMAMDPMIAGSGILENLQQIYYYKSILFWAAIIQSIFGGLVAGKISEGFLSAGLKHIVLLMLITIIFFNAFNV